MWVGGQMANARAQLGFVEKSKPAVCVCVEEFEMSGMILGVF